MVNVIANAAVNEATYPVWLVCVLGFGIVFLGLICLILLCYVMSGIVRSGNKNTAVVNAPAPVAAVPVASTPAISADEKGRVIAAVSCAIAEEMGTQPEAIRITSIKRV